MLSLLTRFLAALVVLLSAAPQARAAELQWSSAACGDPGRTLLEVERLLGRPLASVEGMRFEVLLERTSADAIRVLISTHLAGTPDEKLRELTGRTCDEAADAAAVAIAMAVTGQDAEPAPQRASPPPVAAANDAATSEPPTDTSSAAVNTPPADAASALDENAEARSWQMSLGLRGAIDHGALPRLAGGPEATLSLRYGSLKLTALGAYFVPQNVRLAGDDRGGEFSLLLGGLLGCGEGGPGRLALRACGGVELGTLRGEGLGLNRPRTDSAFWRALRVEGALGWELVRKVSLVATVALCLPLARPEFYVDVTDRVHRVDRLTLRGLLGVEFVL